MWEENPLVVRTSENLEWAIDFANDFVSIITVANIDSSACLDPSARHVLRNHLVGRAASYEFLF